MSPLSSLHALESTFPGWPEYEPLSTGFMLMLTLGAPLLIGLVFTAISVGLGRGKELSAANRAAGMGEPERAAMATRPMRGVETDDDAPTGGAHAAARGI